MLYVEILVAVVMYLAACSLIGHLLAFSSSALPRSASTGAQNGDDGTPEA